jgi:hypothetical protein
MVRDGEEVHAGDVLASIPRETTKTRDITGGLPRVVELFEGRKPRESAIMAEINGVVKYGEIAKGQRRIYIVGDDGQEREYSLPRGVHINVQEGERVAAGDPLMDGPRNPHDLLDVRGDSYGFRPGRSAHQAVEQAQKYIAEGYRWVVDLDLEKFFDRVNHDRLMAKVAERVGDKRLLKLIRAFLMAGVMEDGLVNPVDEGTPQG